MSRDSRKVKDPGAVTSEFRAPVMTDQSLSKPALPPLIRTTPPTPPPRTVAPTPPRDRSLYLGLAIGFTIFVTISFYLALAVTLLF